MTDDFKRHQPSHRMAFRNTTDYACAVQYYPAPGWWERILRAVGFQFWRNYE